MDSVALPPEGADIYIPTISGAESAAGSQEHPVQMPAIVAPLMATRRTFVADGLHGAPILQYSTTFCTQVQFAQTTFHYPPTPPIETADLEKGHPMGRGSPQLPMDAENHLEKSANPFPSLPTPPDLTSISAAEQCQPPATMAASPRMDSAKHSPTPWQAQNFFMSQQSAPILPFGSSAAASSSIAARRQAPQPPALYYPVPERRASIPGSSPKKMIPPLVKDVCGGLGMGMGIGMGGGEFVVRYRT